MTTFDCSCQCGNRAWQSCESRIAGPAILANGARVIRYADTGRCQSDERSGLALCRWHDEYVVWVVVRRDHGWEAYHSDYYGSFGEAAVGLADRTRGVTQ
jgi:hypothetical protein